MPVKVTNCVWQQPRFYKERAGSSAWASESDLPTTPRIGGIAIVVKPIRGKSRVFARLENATHHVVKLTRILCRCHIDLNDCRVRCKRGPCHGRIDWWRKAFQNQTA